MRGVATGEVFDQMRQHRDDQAERQHVDQHGKEDEDQRGVARARQGGVQGAGLLDVGPCILAARRRIAHAGCSRRSPKRSPSSFQRALTCRPAAAASAKKFASVYLWLYSTRIASSRANANGRPATCTAWSRRLTSTVSMRCCARTYTARCAKASRSKSLPISRFRRASRLRVNAAVTPAASL